MNNILEKRTILKKDTLATLNAEYYREFNGLNIPVSKAGDCWILISDAIANMKISDIQSIEWLRNKLDLAGVNDLIDLINERYPRCVKDLEGNYIGYGKDVTVIDILDGYEHNNNNGTWYLKTGIYNQYLPNNEKGIFRNHFTADIEFDFFLFLVLLSGFQIKENETVFVNQPFENLNTSFDTTDIY